MAYCPTFVGKDWNLGISVHLLRCSHRSVEAATLNPGFERRVCFLEELIAFAPRALWKVQYQYR